MAKSETHPKKGFHWSTHPLVKHKLAWLRQPKEVLHSRDYADLMRELGTLLVVEATQDIDLDAKETPNERTLSTPKPHWPVIIPIVRSGLIVADGVRSIMPSRHMGHIGLYHDRDTDITTEFMVTMPTDLNDRYCIIVDAFVVTGRTAETSIKIVNEYGVPYERIIFICLCMSKTAHEELQKKPFAGKVNFFSGRIDGVSDEEEWTKGYSNMNSRLYGTRNKPLRFGYTQE